MQRDKNIKLRVTLSLFIAMAFVSALLTRCASVGTPSGGPKDSLPPVIVGMLPDNLSKNMDTLTKKIYIEFDEFVQLVDQSKQFFTSPQMKNKPQLNIRGRGVVVTLRDTLKKNTTYALNFGSAIQDNNESNPLFSMRYVFSTGDEIDSMIMSGYTEDSYKVDSVSNTFILLYPADSVKFDAERDSTIFNATPAVIGRSENNGIFMAQNLKPIPYYVYALDDTNGNMTYEPGVDRVGFITGTRNPAEMGEFSIWFDSLRKYVVAEPQLHFRMFMDKAFKRHVLSESSRPLQHKAILKFGAEYPQIDSIVFDSIPEGRFIVENLKTTRDSLALWFDMPAEQIPDTIKGRVVYFKHDSLNNLVRTSDPLKLSWRYIETKEMEQAREKLERDRKKAEDKGEEWVEPKKENPFKMVTTSEEKINPEKSITFDFDYPLVQIDTSLIKFTRLTIEEQEFLAMQKKAEAIPAPTEGESAPAVAETPAAPKIEYQGEVHPYTFERDTQNIRRYHLRTEWKEEGDQYFLTINKEAFKDIAGQMNDSIAKKYSLLKRSDFATVIVNVAEDEQNPSHYILELLNGESSNIIERKVGVTPGQVIFNYVPAGSVSLRILQDKNNNGEWDSGDLILRRQPERSQLFSQRGETKIETKVNWEIELSVDPAVLFADETQEDLVNRLEKQERERLSKSMKDGGSGNNKGGHKH